MKKILVPAMVFFLVISFATILFGSEIRDNFKPDRSNIGNPFEQTQGLDPAPAANPSADNSVPANTYRTGENASPNADAASGKGAPGKLDASALTAKEKKIVEKFLEENDYCDSFNVDSISNNEYPETKQRYRLEVTSRELKSFPPQLQIVTQRVYNVHMDEYLPSIVVRTVFVSLNMSSDIRGGDRSAKDKDKEKEKDPAAKDPSKGTAKYSPRYKNPYFLEPSLSTKEANILADKFEKSTVDEMKTIAWETFISGRNYGDEKLLKKALGMYQKLVYYSGGSGKYLCYLGRCNAELYFLGRTNKQKPGLLLKYKNDAIVLFKRAIEQLRLQPDETGSVDIAGVNALLSDLETRPISTTTILHGRQLPLDTPEGIACVNNMNIILNAMELFNREAGDGYPRPFSFLVEKKYLKEADYKCPSKGTYSLFSHNNQPNVFNVSCTLHGELKK